MRSNQRAQRNWEGEALGKHREAITQLAASQDTQRLMQLLRQEGGVDAAARKAAQGDAQELMERMRKLMTSGEGAQLVERITQQAKASGLGQ